MRQSGPSRVTRAIEYDAAARTHLDDFLKQTGFIGDQTPLTIQDIVEMMENDDEFTESVDRNFTSDESDTENNKY